MCLPPPKVGGASSAAAICKKDEGLKASEKELFCDARRDGTVPPIPSHCWRIHGRDYDLAEFVDDHPGGALFILLGKGTDCTNLFESYHIFNEPRKRLRKYDVTDDGLQPEVTQCPSEFMCDLRIMAREYFDQPMGQPHHSRHKSTYTMRVLMALTLIAEVFMGYWWWTRCSMAAAFGLGLLSWLLMCGMSHDASHGAWSSKPWVNYWCQLIGCGPYQTSQFTWWLQHVVSHHQHTNVLGNDVDAHHQCFARWHVDVPYEMWGGRWLSGWNNLWWHFLTFLGATVGMAIIHPLKFIFVPLIAHRWCGGMSQKWKGAITDRDDPRHGFICPTSHDSAFEKMAGNFAEQGVAVKYKSIFVANVLMWCLSVFCLNAVFTKCLLEEEARHLSRKASAAYCAYALFLVLVPYMVSSLCFMTVTQISHIQEACQNANVAHEPDAYKRQVMTSMDYSPDSRLVGFLTGGLNMQSIHHVLPSISSTHYRKMYPKFREVCIKHGCMPPQAASPLHCVASHILYVYRLGSNHQFDHMPPADVSRITSTQLLTSELAAPPWPPVSPQTALQTGPLSTV